jgi:hypothetical protein
MTLGDRCDEIVRLIDETLVSVAGDSPVTGRAAHPSGASLRRANATRPRRLIAVPGASDPMAPVTPETGTPIFGEGIFG